MNYIYASAGQSKNYGDWIIDYATRQMLERYLPAPAAEQDMFSEEIEQGDFDCMIIPGVTMLTPGARPFLKSLDQVAYPIYCLAGNYWVRKTPKRGLLVRNRLLFAKPPEPADLSVIDQLERPVGARDPFTHELLQRSGVETRYMGCPTLHMTAAGVGDDGYVLFSLGRGHVRTQVRAAHQLARKQHVICICHEPHERAQFLAAGLKLPLIDYPGDIELYLSYFRRASIVVTGRLHGALPAIAFKKRVFYFGTRDSRTTLLENIGIPIHSYREIKHADERAVRSPNLAMLDFFESQWATHLAEIIQRHQG